MFRSLGAIFGYRVKQRTYDSNIRKRVVIRQLGLFFLLTILAVQIFIFLNPPEETIASNSGDIVPGGVLSKNDIINVYNNHNDFKNILNYLHIDQSELQSISSKPVRLCSNDNSIVRFTRQHILSSKDGEIAHSIPTSSGSEVFYSLPTSASNKLHGTNTCYWAFVGKSVNAGWFSVVKNNGDIQIKNTQKKPFGQFTNSTCNTIGGFAYDERDTDRPIKVYVSVGTPGTGKIYGPITANEFSPKSPIMGNHGFSFFIPNEIFESKKNSNDPIEIWGIVQPLTGWIGPMVQFTNTSIIPDKCNEQKMQNVTCEDLQLAFIDRNHITATAFSQVQNTSISGVRYTISKRTGSVSMSKDVAGLTNSGVMNLTDPGSYTIEAKLMTAQGLAGSKNCSKNFNISQLENCIFDNTISIKNPGCTECPYNHSIGSKDEDCVSKIVLSKEVHNLTNNVSSSSNNTTVNAGDRIEYLLHTTNLGLAIKTPIEESLANILNYSDIIDDTGAQLDNSTKIVSWGSLNLENSQTDTRRIMMQIKSIPPSPQSTNNVFSYDCTITNSYGNTTTLRVKCPFVRKIQNLIQALPTVEPQAIIVILSSILIISFFLYENDRQNYEAFKTKQQKHMYNLRPDFYDKVIAKFLKKQFLRNMDKVFGLLLAPIVVLFSSVVALTTILILYVAARFLGFSLAGSEVLIALLIGWIYGILHTSLASFVIQKEP